MADTKCLPCIAKWYCDDEEWIYIGSSAGEMICENTEELVFTNIPVIEVIYKNKGAHTLHPRHFNGLNYSAGFYNNSNDEGVLFSDDGIEYNIKVNIPKEYSDKMTVITDTYYGNDRIIAMCCPEIMSWPEWKRMAGFNNRMVLILNTDYEIIDKVYLTTLRECAGFYNGYFYFYDKDYYEKGVYAPYYYKSEDGVNLISITKEEYDSAVEEMDIYYGVNTNGYAFSWENVKNFEYNFYLQNVQSKEKQKIEYETPKMGAGAYSWQDTKRWVDLLNVKVNLVDEKTRQENKTYYVTFDGVYGSVHLPLKMKDLFYNIGGIDFLWANDDYAYLDYNHEKIYRIPIHESFINNTYVQVDDKILGFSQPPVMEDDRTLVPMRFLFEQLGAEVSWDDTTQSATAQITKDFDESMSDGEFVNIAARERQAEQGLGDVIKDKFSVDYQTDLLSSIVGNNNEGMLNTIPQSATADSVSAPPRSAINDCHRQSSPLYTREPGVGENNIVTFSIDNTTATVNGETKTMDVPARLIGDQTFVPLRFLSENLGYTVTWDDATQTAKVLTK